MHPETVITAFIPDQPVRTLSFDRKDQLVRWLNEQVESQSVFIVKVEYPEHIIEIIWGDPQRGQATVKRVVADEVEKEVYEQPMRAILAFLAPID